MQRNPSPRALTPSHNAAAALNSSEGLSEGSTYATLWRVPLAKSCVIVDRYESDDLESVEGSPMKDSPRIFLQDEEASDSSIEECGCC